MRTQGLHWPVIVREDLWTEKCWLNALFSLPCTKHHSISHLNTQQSETRGLRVFYGLPLLLNSALKREFSWPPVSAFPIVTIPQFLSKPSAKSAIICHIPWCFLWPGFWGSPETVPGQTCQPSPLWRPLPHIPASNGLFVLARVPLKKERFAHSPGPDFHPLLSPHPPSWVESWILCFMKHNSFQQAFQSCFCHLKVLLFRLCGLVNAAL